MGTRSAVMSFDCAPDCELTELCNERRFSKDKCDNTRRDYLPAEDTAINTRTMGGLNDGLYAEGLINDQPCMLLLDTGSTISIVSTKIINQCKSVITESRYKQLRMATGQVTPVLGCPTLDITIGRYRGQYEMLVAEIKDSCIIGLDFLQQYQCTLDISGRVLQVDGIQIKLLPHATPLGTMCQRIVTLEPLEIAAGEDTVIPAGLKTGGQRCEFGVIESNYRNNMADGLIFGRTLVDLEDDTLPVRVANVTEGTLKIAASTWIANCHSADYVQPQAHTESRNQHAPLPEHLNDVYKRATEGWDDEQHQSVHILLLEFEDVFASSPSDMGRTSWTQHRINTGDSPPIRQPARSH